MTRCRGSHPLRAAALRSAVNGQLAAGLVSLLLVFSGVSAHAQPVVAPPLPPAAIELPPVDVVGTAPLTGTAGTVRAKVPGSTEVLSRRDLVRGAPASALRGLEEQSGSAVVDNANGNQFAPTLLYRGYEASPIPGDAQGLAVYVNGTRFNVPFGDNVNWDLIPDVAIDRIEVVGANPTFGLNALGGAVSVRLRDGFTYHGGEIELSGGSFGRRQASLQYGLQSGNTAAYVAATGTEEDGWREHSPSRLRQVYGTVGWRGDKVDLNFDVTAVNNHLTGNGTTPIDLLNADRRAVFTYPDAQRNAYVNLRLRGSYEASDSISVQASAYYENFSQRTINGDSADVEQCDNSNLLCLEDGSLVVQRGGGTVNAFLPAGASYGVYNRTATDTNGFGAAVQATQRAELFGRPNRLSAGLTYDGGRSRFNASTALGSINQDRLVESAGIIIAQPDLVIAPADVSASNDYYGIYLQDALDVTDRLTLTASGRFNAAEIRLKDHNGGAVSGDHSFTRLNPAVGGTYKLLSWLTAYAGYSEANRSPTPAELSCASAGSPCTIGNFFVNDPSLKQVVARTWEAGLRGTSGPFEGGWLDGLRLEWHAGLFRAENSDDIIFAASDIVGRGFFRNIGDTRRQGAELGFKLRNGRLETWVSYAYTDATFQSAVTLTSGDNPAADENGLIHVRAGDRLPGIPAHSVKFGASYEVTDAWSVGFTGLAASGRVLRGDESNLNPHTAGYAVIGINTTYHVTKNIQLFGLVQNVFDKDYATFGAFSPTSSVPIVPAPGATNTRSLVPAPPIAGFGGVRVTF